MRLSLKSCSLALLMCAAGALQAAPQHAVTLYDEAPKYPADFTHFDYVNPDAPKGGTLRLSGFGGFDSLNPYISRGTSAEQLGLIYDTLTFHSLDEPFTEYGLVAESIEKAEDGSWVRFKLRPEARFHDGAAITADDVVFTFNTLIEQGAPFYRAYYGDVDSVVADDPHSVTFHFKHSGNRELPLVLGQLPVLPKHYWEGRDFSKGSLEAPLGSGPYQIGQVRPGRSVSFERVKDYWAKDLPVQRGFYNFDRIVVDYYRDGNVTLEAFKAGNFDFRLESSAKNWATAYTGPMFDNGSVVKEMIEHHRPAGMQGFLYNTRRPVFSDPRVRQALAYAFDFEWANKNLFYDQYSRTKSYFENSELASSGLPTGRELEILEPFRDQLSESVFTEPYQPPTTDGPEGLRRNLKTALDLLRSAGYEIREGKMVKAGTGEPLAFEILLFQKTFERVVLPFKNNLARLGIDMTVRTVDSNQYVQRLRNFDFDMIVQTLGQSDSPGNEQRDYWYSSSADMHGSRNYMGVRDPVVDQLVDLVIQAPDRQELVYRVRALDRVLLHGYYAIPQWHLGKDRVAYWNHLVRPSVTPKQGIDLNNWWAKP